MSFTGPPPRSWSRPTAAAPDGFVSPPDGVSYGPGLPLESELRLLGSLEGKRVLDLGCGAGAAAINFARAGAKVIAVDPSAQQLDIAREAADIAGVRIEWQRAHPAELAFVRGDGIDIVWSAYSLAEVGDLDRVFRQVHRVLRQEAAFVFSLPHPAFTMFVGDTDARSVPRGAPIHPLRTYNNPEPFTVDRGSDRVTDTPRTIGAVFSSLSRANFRVDHLLEPEVRSDQVPGNEWAEAMRWVPISVIFRARKQGI